MNAIKVLLIASLLCLGACTPSAREVTYPVMPEALKHCKVYRIVDGDGSGITVMHCPGGTTTTNYKSGKTARQVVVIDGQNFIKEEK